MTIFCIASFSLGGLGYKDHSYGAGSYGTDVLDLIIEAVKTVGVEAKANSTEQNRSTANTVDVSLLTAPSSEQISVPVDEIIVAVESVRRYVVSHLSRIGRAADVDDVMQDIRVAVWDGVTKGRYRQLPGVGFGAWVQGVCANVCASHVRRELSHQTWPLLGDPWDDEQSLLGTPLVLGVDRGSKSGADKIVDQEWTRLILGLVRASVSEAVWKLALASLSTPRQYGPPSPQDRRRWHAVTVVRQTAKTINCALEIDPGSVRDIDDVCQSAAGCLPTEVLRRVAGEIVRPGVSGPERTRTIARVAAGLGVSDRYIAVQIGFARRLYQAAWRILQDGVRVDG